MSVLSPPPSTANYKLVMLTSQMELANQVKLQKRSEQVGNKFDTEVNSLEREKKGWKKVEKDVGSASSQISQTIGRLKSVRSRLDGMLNTVNKAELNKLEEDFNAEVYGTAFDAMLKSLSRDIEKDKSNPNLLGKGDPTLEYLISPTNEKASIQGSRWVLDREGGNLKRYNEYPDDPTSTAGGLNGGIRLDSLVGDQITFTIGQDTASPESFTGTLYTEGLQVMDSWAYNNLASDTDREDAITAVKTAKAAINYQIARYESALTISQFYEERAGGMISGINTDKNSALIEKAQAVQKAQEELDLQFQAALGAVETAAKMNANYAKLLSPVNKGTFASKLFNLLS
jgi:CRISPR/Cas system CSM-associated protein Csm2 small subunit